VEEQPTVKTKIIKSEIDNIPSEVARSLGIYVYLLSDPRSDKPFYVGKGKGKRILHHLKEEGKNQKAQIIEDLQKNNLKPKMEILAHRLPNEECAFRIETAVIDLIGVEALSNRMKGHKSNTFGKASIDQLISHYAARPVIIREPSVLIRINMLYKFDMSDEETYHITRGVWRMGIRRESVHYAFAVYEGVIKGVYEIEQWFPAGTTEYPNHPTFGKDSPGRWEFTGGKAKKGIWKKYVNKSANNYFSKNAQNPVRYVNC